MGNMLTRLCWQLSQNPLFLDRQTHKQRIAWQTDIHLRICRVIGEKSGAGWLLKHNTEGSSVPARYGAAKARARLG
jgi:hypothetical protein